MNAVTEARLADDMLEWLSKRASVREAPFEVWRVEIRFDLEDIPGHELDPPTLREAILRAMAKEQS